MPRIRGKTHTLTALYHLVMAGEAIGGLQEVGGLPRDAGLSTAPAARVAVFVGNAWDPQEGRERRGSTLPGSSPGTRGVELLGRQAAGYSGEVER